MSNWEKQAMGGVDGVKDAAMMYAEEVIEGFNKEEANVRER